MSSPLAKAPPQSYNSSMANVRTSEVTPTRWYRGEAVPMRAIRKFARQVAERFDPEKIILFGSYAHGVPHEDSDVDILVIMPAKRGRRLSVDIRRAIPFDYALDLLVRKPEEVERALAQGQHFLSEVIAEGKVLYAKAHRPVGAQGRSRLSRSKPALKKPAAAS